MNPGWGQRRAPTLTRVATCAIGMLCMITCIMHASGCKDDGTHVYVGQFYLEERQCLGTTSSLDVIAGDEPGTCQPICLIQRRADSGRSVFVSTMCPPYPPAIEFDVSGTDPVCAPALAALARNDTCAIDGGSSNPIPPSPPAADASSEGSADGSIDASAD